MRDDAVLVSPITDFLAGTTIIRLATITPGGRPHLAPFWFWSDDERIVISTLANQTVRNLRVNPDCAVLVDLGEDFRDLCGAQIRGQAVIFDPGDPRPAPVERALEEIDRVHAAELTEDEFVAYEAWETRDHIILEVIPESATWFDLGRHEMGRTGPDREQPIGPAAETAR